MKVSVPASLDLRLRLGQAALLTIEEAAMLLPVPPAQGREWIEGNVRRTIIAGVASVRWADVLRAVEAGGVEAPLRPPTKASEPQHSPRWLSTQEAAEVLGVNRKTLDALARGNLDIPGGPVVVGGQKRVHLRWPATGLDSWLAAVRAQAAPPRKTAKRPSSARRQVQSSDTPTDWSKVRRKLLDR